MMSGLFALSWTPVLLLTALAIVFRQSALALSVWGLVWALVLAKGFFDTPLTVGMMSALDGVFTTLPLMMVILGGMAGRLSAVNQAASTISAGLALISPPA